MERRRLAALAAPFLGVALVGAVLVAVGPPAPVPGGGSGTTTGGAAGPNLTVAWTSDTGRPVGGNHHAPAAANVAGEGYVFAPVSGRANTDDCALVALSAADGSALWNHSIPPAACTIHSVADPVVADYDGDGTPEVLAATTDRRVVALSLDGRVEFGHDLSSYGYTRPVVADLLGGPSREVVVVDARGGVYAVRANGSLAWKRDLGSYTWGQPSVSDLDADGDPEVVVAPATGGLRAFEADGRPAWRQSAAFDSSITWSATRDLDADPATETVVGTAGGVVLAADGRAGEVEWRRDLGRMAAVHAVGDGDGDGTHEVYAVVRDGTLRALSGPDGTTEWTTNLSDSRDQMTPPPAMGDVDGDGDPELVAVTNGGRVALVDPASGRVLDDYRRDVPIYTHPTLADADGDGTLEVYVTYGDGRVVAFEAG